MTGVALEMGFLVVELNIEPDWGLGCGRCWSFWGINLTDRSHLARGDLLG